MTSKLNEHSGAFHQKAHEVAHPSSKATKVLHNIWEHERVNASLYVLGIALAVAGAFAGSPALIFPGIGLFTTGVLRADVEHITSKDLSHYPHGFSNLWDRIFRHKPCPCVFEQIKEAVKGAS